jgi:phosphoglycerate dehydrogenase-like enzyme
MRVVVATSLVGRRFRERLATHAGLTVLVATDVSAAIAMCRGAEVLVTDGSWDPVLSAALRADKGRLHFIQLVTAGYDGLLAHGIPHGVIVSNVGGFYSASVAEHAMALLLGLLRQLPRSLQDTARHVHDRRQAPQLGSLQGATVALIGFGGIGQEVARRLRPFGARIVALVRTPRSYPSADEVHLISHLHEVLARADAAIVAVPLTPMTRGLIGRAAFSVCKRSMILINVARGEVVDSAALAAALQEGRLGGAGLDVTDPEPMPAGHPLWHAPNVIVTPHVGGLGQSGAPDRMADLVLANIDLVVAGKPPLHQVQV